MTRIVSSIRQALGWGGPSAPVEIARTDPAGKPPPEGEASPGSNYAGPVVSFLGAAMVWGGEAGGWLQPPRRSYSTYRQMDLHPMLAKLRSAYDRLRWGEYEWKKRDDAVSDARLKEVKENFAPLRYGLVSECLRALVYGWRGGQKVWERDGGAFILDDLIFYEPDRLNICNYEGRPHAFAGLVWDDDKANRLPPNKSFLFTINGEGGNLYGESYYEAAYDSWASWNRARWDRINLVKKLSGIVPVMKYPHGKSKIDVNGTEKSNREIALEMLASLKMGMGSAVPNSQYSPDKLQADPNLVKLPTWELEFLDAGNHSPAIMGVVGGQDYDDKSMCRAMRLSERAQIEAVTAGSRADSETHGDTDVSQLESIGGMIAHAFNAQCVDEYLLINHGPEAVGEVYAVQPPLTDRKTAVFREYGKAVQAHPVYGKVLVENTDNEAVFGHLGVPVSKDLNEAFKTAGAEADARQEEERRAKIDGMKAAPQPGSNGRITANN